MEANELEGQTTDNGDQQLCLTDWSGPNPDRAGEPTSRTGSVAANNDNGTSVREPGEEERPQNTWSSQQTNPLVACTSSHQTAHPDEPADLVGAVLKAVSRSPMGGALQALGLMPAATQDDAPPAQESEERLAQPPQQPTAVTKRGIYQKLNG